MGSCCTCLCTKFLLVFIQWIRKFWIRCMQNYSRKCKPSWVYKDTFPFAWNSKILRGWRQALLNFTKVWKFFRLNADLYISSKIKMNNACSSLWNCFLPRTATYIHVVIETISSTCILQSMTDSSLEEDSRCPSNRIFCQPSSAVSTNHEVIRVHKTRGLWGLEVWDLIVGLTVEYFIHLPKTKCIDNGILYWRIHYCSLVPRPSITANGGRPGKTTLRMTSGRHFIHVGTSYSICLTKACLSPTVSRSSVLL